MAYSYDRRKSAEEDRTHLYLWNFRRLVQHMGESEEQARNLPEDPRDLRLALARLEASVVGIFDVSRKVGVYLLFLKLLQDYKLSPSDRKVIERAAKEFAKTRKQRVPAEKVVGTFLKNLEDYRLYLATAERVLAQGEVHTEESGTTLKAGPFVLVNAGGFDDRVMKEAAKVVEQAARLLAAKSLSRVCYGNIQVTNTVGRSTRVLAFYMQNSDSFFIRANLKGKVGPALASVLHEMGHRLHHKFLQSKDAGIRDIYRQIKSKTSEMARDRSLWPPIGTEVKGKQGVYKVVGYTTSKGEVLLALESLTTPGRQATISITGWMFNEGKTPFVSSYAATEYAENFAEMIAFYCQNLLPDDQVALLETVL